ncbi:MAG: type 1 glutamine amidotransferase [Verrucomicrobia bacterium]|nr:type 1 glutamine amidotransferase [Verrucomicrobiota bacterium]
MRVQVFQHVPFEGTGAMDTWFARHGATVRTTHWYAHPEFPSLDGVDLLVIMGGPMSVHDEMEYEWLRTEKVSIRHALTLGIPILGICLGAQLLADVLGARVYQNKAREIGWFPVESEDLPEPWQGFRFPPSLPVLHWHGETFDLPVGARRLAKSDACLNQAFQYGDRTIGLQFHLESTSDLLADLVQHCQSEMTPGAFVQPPHELLAPNANRIRSVHACMDRLLSYLTRHVTERQGMPA